MEVNRHYPMQSGIRRRGYQNWSMADDAQFRLKEALVDVERDYDYVILDALRIYCGRPGWL